MSSISFSHSGGPGHRHSSSPLGNDHEEHDFQPSFHHHSSSFDQDGSMAFQVNPLSMHPPRSPHPSMTSSSQVYGRDIYNGASENEKVREKEDDDEQSESGKAVEEAKQRVATEAIWQEVFASSSGRYKSLKVIQYSIRLFLLLHTTSSGYRFKHASWETSMVKRLESTSSGLGLTRSCLNLFEWLGPMTSILAQHHEDPFPLEKSTNKRGKTPLLHTFLHAPPPVLLDFVNCIADDVYTLSRLGLIGQRLGSRAARFADWCWFTSVLVDLVENSVERGVLMDLQRQVESRLYTESMTGATSKSNPTANKVDEKELARLRRQDFWMQVTRLKLIMDLIFVSYDVFNYKRAKGPVQTITGLISAILSTTKFYDSQKTTLSKALAR